MSTPPHLPNNQDEQNEMRKQQKLRNRDRYGQQSPGVGLGMPDMKDVEAINTAGANSDQARGMRIQEQGPVLMSAAIDYASRTSLSPLSLTDQSRRMVDNPSLRSKELKSLPDKKEKSVDGEWGSLQKIDASQYIGWDIDLVQVQELPMYFPKDCLRHDFPLTELPDVLYRVSSKCRHSSIQASLMHSPLSARLQTCDGVELYLVFFEERLNRRKSTPSSEKKCFMSVQRHKGDQMLANQCIHEIVDAAKGLGVDDGYPEGEDAVMKDSMSADTVQAMEKLIERVMETAQKQTGSDFAIDDDTHPYLSQTPEQMTKGAIQDIHSWLEFPKRLDLRRHAMEYLVVMTDLKRTLSSTAIAGALMVLQGKAPAGSGMDSQAKAIQSFVLTVLQHRELEGDREMFEGMTVSNDEQDSDLEMLPYFPEEPANLVGLPRFYIEYMNELFNLALQVLVNSLEVVACFYKSHGLDTEAMAVQLLETDGADLYAVLLRCVDLAETKLANGYLACKALRLLSIACPGLKMRLRADDTARVSISNAYTVGQASHILLKDESYQLWETVRD